MCKLKNNEYVEVRRKDLREKALKKTISSIDTSGKIGYVEYFDENNGKYKIIFDGGWCGWYARCELKRAK